MSSSELSKSWKFCLIRKGVLKTPCHGRTRRTSAFSEDDCLLDYNAVVIALMMETVRTSETSVLLQRDCTAPQNFVTYILDAVKT
jgi:hypothetical protein